MVAHAIDASPARRDFLARMEHGAYCRHCDAFWLMAEFTMSESVATRPNLACSEPGHRAPVAIHASRGPGREAWAVRREETR